MPEVRATIVLVHGAWHGPWCWQLLRPELLARGLAVRVFELPSVASATPVGLVEDARALTALLSDIAGPVILCGHSYGGMVLSAADLRAAHVQQLVYLCAYMTEAQESVESSLRAAGERRPGHWLRRLSDGRAQVDAARAAALFYNDCPDATQSWAVAQLRPQWAQALSQVPGRAAWREYPSAYVVCSEDQALDPRIQREVYAVRAGQLFTLPSGHSPFLSRPLQLAQVLASLAH